MNGPCRSALVRRLGSLGRYGGRGEPRLRSVGAAAPVGRVQPHQPAAQRPGPWPGSFASHTPKRALRLCSDRMFSQLVSARMLCSTSKTGSWALALVFLGGVALIADIVSIRMIGSNANQFQSVVGPARPPAAPVGTVEVLVATRDLPVGTVLLTDEKPWITKAV